MAIDWHFVMVRIPGSDIATSFIIGGLNMGITIVCLLYVSLIRDILGGRITPILHQDRIMSSMSSIEVLGDLVSENPGYNVF